jgi:hypothetical protein
MIDLADHIVGFRAADYLPYGLKWLFVNDPDRQDAMVPIDLRQTEPEAAVREARIRALNLMPDDADGFFIELGGIGVHEERRETFTTRS